MQNKEQHNHLWTETDKSKTYRYIITITLMLIIISYLVVLGQSTQTKGNDEINSHWYRHANEKKKNSIGRRVFQKTPMVAWQIELVCDLAYKLFS